ncbi:MAG: hypothetical protein M0Q51_02860 [Bacteroidales bacterium]|nr:hypothetical protein [Bacteroidales bacterium]
MNEEIVYSLNKTDMQTVALEELNRELTDKEIEEIKDKIAENINWFDAISDAIKEKLKK